MWHNRALSILFLFVCSYFFSMNTVLAKSKVYTSYKINQKPKYSYLSVLELDANGCNKNKACRKSKGLRAGVASKNTNIILAMLGIDEMPEVMQFQDDLVKDPKNAFSRFTNSMLEAQYPNIKEENTIVANNTSITGTISQLGGMFINPNNID